jgi:Na+(H+)/acetate symporter ActP
MAAMADRGAAAESAEAARMQAGSRAWLLRTTRDSGHRLRELSPPALLSLVCAGALAPLLSVGAGITGAVAVAGVGVLSSVGSGVLGEITVCPRCPA